MNVIELLQTIIALIVVSLIGYGVFLLNKKNADDKNISNEVIDLEKKRQEAVKRQEEYDKLINDIDNNLKNKKEIYDKRKQDLYNNLTNRPDNDPTGKRN